MNEVIGFAASPCEEQRTPTLRQLTATERQTLQQQGCWAENWDTVLVAKGFLPTHVTNVQFYGHVTLGVFEREVEVSPGFMKHTGIHNATLRNTQVGDNCLIERIGNYINNYTIAKECIITNVCTIETTPDATFGEGTMISVLSEVGPKNMLIYSGLTSQIATLMVNYQDDKEFISALYSIIRQEIAQHQPSGHIGSRARILNTSEIRNSMISRDCLIEGASRLYNCSLRSDTGAPIYVGSGTICENSILFSGSSVRNSCKLQNCFVGEACTLTNGFTAENSVFFNNCYMANGEACAAFCGPFTASHHKSTLLIGGMFSFYNAGSNTNFSNHAYKMGPMHYGTLERGVKTGSGAYILMPAKIGQFSVCFGKLMFHPDTRKLPFSYIICEGEEHLLVPGRNLTTVGLYRDIRKWPERDKRKGQARHSLVNFDWLSPFSAGRIMTAKRTLEDLQRISGDKVQSYNFQDYVIKASSLRKGIKYYDIALRIYMGAVMKRHSLCCPKDDRGKGKWNDLSGLLIPLSEEQRIVAQVKDRAIQSTGQIVKELQMVDEQYAEFRWAWSYRLICEYYNVKEITPELAEQVHKDYVQARRTWIAEIRKDAVREFELGDVPQETLDHFLHNLDKEVEFENMKYDM